MEGAEWSAFDQMASTGILHRVDQLSIELHLPGDGAELNLAGRNSGVTEVFRFFELCEAANLLPFSWEVNHNPSGFNSKKPYCVEYSFVRPDSGFIRVPIPGIVGGPAPGPRRLRGNSQHMNAS